MQKTTNEALRKQIKYRVYKAHEIATAIYNEYKTKLSQDEILKMIKVALGGVRYDDGKGYFFMDDINGNKILHPVDTSIEGKNFLKYTDVRGYKLFEAIVKTIKDKTERFDEYYWYKPNTNKEVGKKVSFYKYFEPLNMAIGTGIYVDDFEKNVQKDVLNYLSMTKFSNNSDYIFVLDKNLNIISHKSKEMLDKNIDEISDIQDFKKVIQDLKSKNDLEGYYTYKYHLSNQKSVNKISFIKVFEDWGWILGTGFHEDELLKKIEFKKDELNKVFDEYIQKIIIIGFLSTILLLVISFYISQIIENKFTEYKKDLNKSQTLLHQQSKMAAMGEMIGNIAHQWRQPLSTITTVASGMSLQKEMGFLTDEMFFDGTKKINASAQHLSKTIDDFRNFFSPDKVKTKFSIKNTFATTLDLISAQFNSKDIKIIKHIENLELYSYENELIQALINILNNARDELTNLPENIERLVFIDVYENKSQEIVIIIKDNAGGIAEDIIDKVFEPYFTTKHKSQGTGIGLYMTEEIIVKHLKGKILVKNKDFIYKNIACKGAQFKIVLSTK